MKIIKKLVSAFALSIIIALNSSGLYAQDKIIIVNGHFFKEMPSEVKKSLNKGMKMFMLSTPNGTKAAGISIPISLSDKALTYSIPVEDIPEGEELLRRYEEAAKKSKRVSMMMVSSKPLVKAGDMLPEFTAKDIDGRVWTSDDIKGKVVVLNLWYTGCGPCRAEMPELSEWKNEMPEVMFFSSTYESADIARPVIKSRGFNWIPLVNDTLFHKYIGNNGYPLTMVVDKDGKIVKAEYGTSPEQRADLKEAIKSLR